MSRRGGAFAAKISDASWGKEQKFGFFRIFRENKDNMYENRPRK